MSRRPSRKPAGKEKWKLKKWFMIRAPRSLGGGHLYETPADSEEAMLGRVCEVTLNYITGNPEDVNFKFLLEVIGVRGSDAITTVKRYEWARDFLRSLVQKGTSKVVSITDHVTKDGTPVRLEVVVITARRIQNSKKKAIRRLIRQYLSEKIPQLTYDELCRALMYRKLDSDIDALARKIYPTRHSGIFKMKRLGPAKILGVLEVKKRERRSEKRPEEGVKGSSG